MQTIKYNVKNKNSGEALLVNEEEDPFSDIFDDVETDL